MHAHRSRGKGIGRKLAAAAIATAALAAPGASQAATPKLTGTVGPGFTITLKTAAGKNVTALKAGSYRIVVSDKSRMHDFHLRGPGLNKVLTSVDFVGSKSVTVRLRAGNYSFRCQPHAPAMHSEFVVR